MNPFEQFLEDAKRIRLTPEEKQSIKFAVSQHMTTRSFLSFFSMSIFKPVSWAVAMLAVAFIGVGSYAYVSPQVTKGDALYSWKTSFERMKVRGADTQLEKVQVYSALALRRLAEAKVLARELGASDLPTVVSLLNIPVAYAQTTTDGAAINGVEAQFDETGTAYFLISTTGEVTAMTEAAIEEAEEITDPAELQDALEVIDETQAESLEGLEEVAGEVGTEASEELLDAVAVALDETAQDAAEVDAALEEVAEALESGDTEVSVDVETGADIVAAADDADGEEAADETSDENTVKLEAAQQTIATFKANLLESGVSEEDAQKLFDRVDAKLLKAQEALEDGNVNKMKGLLKATNALTNNAKHFAKKAQQEDDEDEADEDGEEEEAASEEDDTGDEVEDEDAADDSADVDESLGDVDADATEEESSEDEAADASVDASASESVEVKANTNKPESPGKSSGKGKKNE